VNRALRLSDCVRISPGVILRNSLMNCVPTHHASRFVFNIPRLVKDSLVALAEGSGLCVLLKGISVARSPFNHAAVVAGGDGGIRCIALC